MKNHVSLQFILVVIFLWIGCTVAEESPGKLGDEIESIRLCRVRSDCTNFCSTDAICVRGECNCAAYITWPPHLPPPPKQKP
ncbi:unnamed protein product [Rhodiola kirilowii]